MKTKQIGVPCMPRAPVCAFFVASALVLPSLVSAQEVSGSIEEIVVQGTATGTGIRGVAPVGSQTLSISREDLLESPVRNSAEIISTLPQGSQQDTGIASGEGGNNTGNAGLNLRGLGTNASLMLLDGHRMVGQGASSIAPDPNAIPFAAIERVEVVLDGASSVYGSDAVAGVVNFRMRDDFEGIDIQMGGQSGVYDSGKVEIVAGHSWDNANLMVGLTKEYISPMMESERDYLRQDLRAFGGNDNRLRGNGSPGPNGLIRVGNSLYAIPATFAGTIPDVSELSLATEADVVDAADYATYRGSSDIRNAFVRAGFDLSEDLRIDYTGMVSKRESRTLQYSSIGITVTNPTHPDNTQFGAFTSPYWIDGLTTRANYTVRINANDNGIPWSTRNYARTQNHYLDLTWDVGEYQVLSSVFWGDTKGCDICRPEGVSGALSHDPGGTPDGYLNYNEVGVGRGGNPEWFNPYLGADVDQPGFANHLVGATYRSGEQWQSGVNLRLEGPVAELPGGTMRGSIGTEYVDSNHWLWLNQDTRYYPEPAKSDYVLRDTTYSREVGSMFAEVYVPLVGDGNAMPGVQRLAVNLSVRRDEYSDFGGTTNPRVGVSWDVNDDLTVRASWGTAFRAPTVEQVNPGVNSVLAVADRDVAAGLDIPQLDTVEGTAPIFDRSGRTPNLGPETADMWGIGFDYSPYQLEGLDMGVTYYKVEYEDRIENLPNWQTAFTSAEVRQRYAPYITTFTQPAGCVEGNTTTYHPAIQALLDYPGTRFVGNGNDCQATALIDRGLQNVGAVNQSGLDVQASYSWDNDFGLWRVSGNVAKILELERSFGLGTEFFDVLDHIGWQNSLRANMRLSWANDNWSAALSSRTEGGYTNDDTPNVTGVGQLPDQEVDSWTTFDMTVSYRTPDDGSMLSGINASLGIQNLTDKEPPIVLNGTDAVDTGVHNVFGRMYRLELSKRF